jgi:hypothetical protein
MSFMKRSSMSAGLALALCGVLATAASATDPCGLCDEEVVTNSALAQCFLDEYPFIAGKAKGPVVVDLSQCEQERSIVQPLGTPGTDVAEPSVTFMATPTQLDCLKKQLEQRQAAELDPSVTIELDSCE